MTCPAMSIEMVQPAQRMSMNDRLHWRAQRRLTRAWRTAAYTFALSQLGRAPSERRRPPCFVRVEFPVPDPGRRRDPHNTAPTVKAIIDGLVDAGVWPDDTDEFVIVVDPRFYKPIDGPFQMAPVRVHLTERTGDLPNA